MNGERIQRSAERQGMMRFLSLLLNKKPLREGLRPQTLLENFPALKTLHQDQHTTIVYEFPFHIYMSTH
ncbi:CLUMA_CG010808, isoform A [Clunio marinus]|uniref:CLUMA_CG010808, isoform A n=1 Tax=Clunio marinus TaxID=568069 RepID=A0A1J1IB33_9DIPT|nr:CLUMA_CG010808, isoform A [Clunio marinus]